MTDKDILKYGKNVPYFRGVFSRDAMPKKPWKNESGVVNLDDSSGPGTHWTAYKKRNSNVYWFDSFGNLKAPPEILEYFKNNCVKYNYERFQNFETVDCGHWCLDFLYKKHNPSLFKTVCPK